MSTRCFWCAIPASILYVVPRGMLTRARVYIKPRTHVVLYKQLVRPILLCAACKEMG